jgi:hypothetical protein
MPFVCVSFQPKAWFDQAHCEDVYAGEEMARIAAKSYLTAALGGAGCWIGDNLYGQTTPYFKAVIHEEAQDLRAPPCLWCH